MISALYAQLREIAAQEFDEIVLETEVILSGTGRSRKLRLFLIDDTFIDIWYSDGGDYAYHWEQREKRRFVYRHDNAPHKAWRQVATFPKHCHAGTEDHVIESFLPNEPSDALRAFLREVRRLMVQFATDEGLRPPSPSI